MIAGGSDHLSAVDTEAMRRRRQQRLEWARRSPGAGSAEPDRPTGAPVGSGAQPTRQPSGANWSVDVAMLDRHRIVRGWSRRELAAAAHVDPKTLRDLLGRRRRPDLGTVQAVTATLGLTLVDVITFE